MSVAVLMEAGFDVHFRIPTDATLDAVDPIIQVTLLPLMGDKS
jgi:hypothetical protein